jgi:mRNA interferase RelE/StbE
MFEVVYQSDVVQEDIPKLSEEWKLVIRYAIEKKLMTRPEIYGKPLRQSLAGYRKLRVGDYRVIFRIEREVVKIFVIQHRSRVYKTAEKRTF